jgi:hypothetical protein
MHPSVRVDAWSLMSARTRVRPCERAHVRVDVSARTHLVLPQVTSKRTLQCV